MHGPLNVNVFWYSLQNDVAKFTENEARKQKLIFFHKNKRKTANVRVT